MNGLMVLLKKELLEQWRTSRIIIVGGIFLFFGLSTPLLIKYLPELIKMAGPGMTIEMPPPTAIQAMTEYTSTMMQFGVLIAVLVAMGAVAKERESGTAALVLTKPVGRLAFILAKFKAMSFTLLVATVAGGLACWGYTYGLFGNAPFPGFTGQNLLLLLYLMLAVAQTILFSSVFKSQLAAAGLGLVAIIIESLIVALPWIGKYAPGELTAWGNALVAGIPFPAAWGAVIVTLGLILLSLYLVWVILRKKEL
jgi:ABC-2 type transport system permease protein